MKDKHGNEVQPLPDLPGVYRVYYHERGEGVIYRSDYQTANEVTVQVPTRGYHIDMTFEWPNERHKAVDLCRMLERAYEYGIEEGKRQVRHVLGI